MSTRYTLKQMLGQEKYFVYKAKYKYIMYKLK